MAAKIKPRLLVNLPGTFFETKELAPAFRRLAALDRVRKRSWNRPEEIAADLSWADAVLMWSWPVFTDDLLEQAPNLRFSAHINVTAAGARACLKRGIAVSEARHGWSPAVAEMALTLILCGLRKVSGYHAAMRQGKEKWVEKFPVEIDPLERQLTGRSVGIVGFGVIGQRLAQLLAPFDVPLQVYDPFVPAKILQKYGARRVSLLRLARRSDAVVLCAVNKKNTTSLVDKNVVAAFRPGCVLVNVGRSSLIDMDALRKRLKKGDMTAMLDVFDREPLEKDSPLRSLPNAFLTPHRAGGLMESVQRILGMLTDDFEAFLNGKKRTYVISEEMLHMLPDW